MKKKIKNKEVNSLEVLDIVQMNAVTSGTLVAWERLAAFIPVQSLICANPHSGEGDSYCREAPLAPASILMGIV